MVSVINAIGVCQMFFGASDTIRTVYESQCVQTEQTFGESCFSFLG